MQHIDQLLEKLQKVGDKIQAARDPRDNTPRRHEMPPDTSPEIMKSMEKKWAFMDKLEAAYKAVYAAQLEAVKAGAWGKRFYGELIKMAASLDDMRFL